MCEIRVRDCYYYNKPTLRRVNMIKVDMNIVCDNLDKISEDFDTILEKRYNINFSSKEVRVEVNLSEDEMKYIGLFCLSHIFSKDM